VSAPAARQACIRAVDQALREGRVVVVWCALPHEGPQPPRELEGGSSREGARHAARDAETALRAALSSGPAGAAAGASALRSSRSACVGLGAVALATHAPVGVDVEALQGAPQPDDALRRLALHEGEEACDATAFMELWVRKEAALKAFGVGLALPPRQLEVGPAQADWRALNSPWGGHAWLCSLSSAPSGHRAAVALACEHVEQMPPAPLCLHWPADHPSS
jgi:hypothetical protein